ncbi:microtubule binding protein [Epithele typhae]|uniref:microtubule binding protein n=1 Tax=Epithele typhae TaxID=378194 RepID=UPI002008751C|nr:microtubule binding protein [Epithele typhae]KAH9913090.1 microtubule binding protein [Epithele typhae]
MSRFVRASKYRHVFGQTGKKEYGYDNVKVTNSAWDTNVVAASTRYVSLNWQSSGGGAFAILPLPNPFAPLPTGFPYKLPDIVPLARSHTAPVLDTDWSPFNDSIVASAGEDGKTMIWKVDPDIFEGWGLENWEPTDFDPVARIDLWDLAAPEAAKSVLGGHADAIQSLCFNPSGTLLATTSRDRKIRIFDPRTGGEPVRLTEGHGGIKGARVVWMGDKDRLATTGFSKMSDRQIALWETGSLSNVKMMTIDQTSGVLMPFWTDNNILFLAGKGDGNIRYYEYENDNLFPLSEYKSSDPQRGMCFLPRRGLSVSDCEIARAFKVAASSIEAIGFIVPRKSDSFQSDIFPPAPSAEPSLTSAEFFSGKTAPPNLVSLEDGSISTGATPVSLPPSSSISTPAPAPTPSRTMTAPPPAAAPPVASIPSISEPVSASRSTPMTRQASTDDSAVSALKAENARLTEELYAAREETRDCRAQIRQLELQVEAVRANARKAAALLDA